jgi:hypothetical protein
MLKQHSQLVGSRIKEVHYFDNDIKYKKKSIDFYHAFFKVNSENNIDKYFFEATPIYLYHPEVPRRSYEYNPNLKIIVLVRDPIERMISAWVMYHYHFATGAKSKYHETRTLNEVIRDCIQNQHDSNFYNNRKGYLQRGVYINQIMNFLKYFNFRDMIFINSQDLRGKHSKTMRRIFDFIRVEKEPLTRKILNKASRKVDLVGTDEYEILKEFFYYPNKQLFKLTGISFDV